jgi:nucleotide-binding universal stress UspA family protein
MTEPVSSAHETIVVGVDTSPESIAALRWAARLASHMGAKLLAVHAEGLLEEGAYVPRVDVEDLITRTLAGEPLRASTSSLIEPGHPADTLLRVAERTHARHIVVGHRGVGSTAADIGSTAFAVVSRSTIPVTVVRNV